LRTRRRTIQLALAFSMIASVSGSAEGVAISVCSPDGHCYENNEAIGSSNTNSWATARDAAIGAGGHLVTITSAEENAFLVANFLSEVNAGAFIGLSQAPGFATEDAGWQWVTGEAYVFTNWNGGEPNDGGDIDNVESGLEDFGHFFFSAAGLWNDLPSPFTSALPFIVEYEPDPNGTVPEPSTLTLLGLGVAAAWGWSRRKR
jgi:hypothetical protein